MASRGVTSVLQFIRLITTAPSGEATDSQLLHRFAQGRDQDAFAALVERHGPMVWGVCERALRQAEDAEDAFQATFLVLARRAGSIGQPGLLGNWLYGVACRTTREARGKNFRRQVKERQLVPPTPDDTDPEIVWSDLRPLLDEEVNGLPVKYRTPFILCYLRGMTNEEAARHLGCPAGTVMSRLAWARERLRTRLTRRGITLSSGLLAAVLSQQAAAAAPLQLMESTINAVALLAAGQTLIQVASAKVAALTERTLRSMLLSKLRNVSLVVLCTAVLGVTAGGLLLHGRAALPQEQPAAVVPAKTISSKPAEIDDLADLLRVTRRSGRVELHEQLKGGYLVIDFYKQGQKQSQRIQGAGFGIGGLANLGHRYDRIDFAMQALDMDFLQVGDGKKEHCRVLLKTVVLGPSAPLSSSTHDVAKELFDFSQAKSGGAFGAEASSGRVIPLCWLMYGGNSVSGAGTVAGIIERNPQGNVAIVSLQLDE